MCLPPFACKQYIQWSVSQTRHPLMLTSAPINPILRLYCRQCLSTVLWHKGVIFLLMYLYCIIYTTAVYPCTLVLCISCILPMIQSMMMWCAHNQQRRKLSMMLYWGVVRSIFIWPRSFHGHWSTLKVGRTPYKATFRNPLCPSPPCSWGKVQCSKVRRLFEAQDRVLKTKFGSLGRRPPTPFI